MWSRRVHVALATSIMLVIATAAPVIAISQSVTPSSQSHAYGVASTWTQSWGGNAPFDVAFCPRNSPTPTVCFTSLNNTNLVSRNRSYTFYPCRSTTFQQYAWVRDQGGAGAQSTIYTYATEGAGAPC